MIGFQNKIFTFVQKGTATSESNNEVVIDITPEKPIDAENATVLTSTETASEPIVIDIIPEKPIGAENTTVLTSTETTSEPSNEIILDFLPEKPTPVDSSITDTIQFMGDPPFDMLGLNSLWPPGRAQWLMEHIHNDLDIPWWGTILVSKYFLFSFYSVCKVKCAQNAESGYISKFKSKNFLTVTTV